MKNLMTLALILGVIAINFAQLNTISAQPLMSGGPGGTFVNSYVDYKLKEGENVESRIWEYKETRPSLFCSLQPVFEPKNLKTCEPSVE